MPTAPRARCLITGCSAYAFKRGRCEDHYTPWEQRSQNTKQISSKERAVFRRIVLRRDPVCRSCGTAPSTDADHIIPVADGGAHHSDNGQGLCHDCHDAKTRAENAARNRARARR